MSMIGHGVLPVMPQAVHIRREAMSKCNSCVSFSTNFTLGDIGGTLDDLKEPYALTDSALGSESRHSTIDEKSMSSPLYPPCPEPTLDVVSPPCHSVDAPRAASYIV
jgi:hypothetical protein